MSRPRFHRIVPALLRRFGLARWLSYSHPLVLSGQRFSIPIKEGLGEDLLKLEPDFKSQLIDFFGPGLPDTFVDIGANLGQTIVEAFSIRKWRSYLALEPNPEVCAYLQALVYLNRLPVQILPWAAGSEAAMHLFCTQGKADASATMAPEGRPGVYAPESSQWVAAYPLDRLLEFVTLPRGLMIKIDVEGFEASVLDGASRVLDEVRPIIMCEVLRAYAENAVEFTHQRMGRLEDILGRHRYRIFYVDVDESAPARIRVLREIKAFPRGLWKENPTGFDYCFLPAEMRIPVGKTFEVLPCA